MPAEGVELRLGKICRCLAQDLVGLTQLAVLALQGLDPIAVLGRGTGPQPLITRGPAHPAAERLARAADLACDRVDRRPL